MSLEIQSAPQGSEPAGRQISVPASSGEQLTLMELWKVMMKQRFIILAVAILSAAVAAWVAYHTTPVYESIGRIEIQPQETPGVSVQQLMESVQNSDDTMALTTEVHILQSDEVLFETAQSLHLLDAIRGAAARERKNGQPAIAPGTPMTQPERRAMIGMIRGGLKVAIVPQTNLVEIRYRNPDPKLAAAVVNRLVETYSDVDLRSKYERTKHVSDWLQKQLEDLKTEAADAQQALADYQKTHNIVGTDENSNLTIQTLENLSSSLNSAEADRILKEARMRDFDSMAPNLVPLMGDNPTLTSLRNQLADLESQRAEMSARYGPKYPKMIDLQTEIDKVQAQINGEVDLARRQIHDEYQAALGSEDALHKRLGQQEEEAYKLNEGAAHDDVSPIDAPRRAAWRPGLYLSRVPGIPKLDVRVEAATTDPPSNGRTPGQLMYWEAVERQGYTNQGQIFGDWIGREDKGGQGWVTYHLSGNEWVQLGYRNQKAEHDFIPGGTTLNDFNVQAVKRIRKDLELDGNFTVEHWNAPIYLPGEQTVTATTVRLTWYPQRKVSF